MKHHHIALLSILASCANAQENQCIICPNGITAAGGDDWAPYAYAGSDGYNLFPIFFVNMEGDPSTCAELVDSAKQYEAGSESCASSEIHELYCCYTAPENPCTLCPNGATFGYDFVPNASNATLTCRQLIDSAALLATDSDYCAIFGEIDELDCCPTVVAVVDPPDNACVICPNGPGTGLDDYPPYAAGGDTRTCADLIDEARQYESGTADCGRAELDEYACCYSEPVNPCIICPGGVTAAGGEGYVPEYDGNDATCAELVAGATLFESGSDACALWDIDIEYCCPTPDDACIVCPNGPTTGLDDYPPYAASGDTRTCADLIAEAKEYESGTEDCGLAEFHEVGCCYTEPVNPCIICPGGVAASLGDDYVPEYEGNTATCADLIAGGMTFESGSDACALWEFVVGYCCPSDALPENTCIICSDGPSTGLDDYPPYAASGDSRTCADLIDEAKEYESGTEDCGYAELGEYACCFSEPVNPCIICPGGVTASLGDDYVPEYEGNTATCAGLVAGAMSFESGSDACEFAYDIDIAYCCPPEPPTPSPVVDTITSTTTTSSTSVAGDPCIICPGGATAGYDDVQPGGAGETKTCKEMLDGMANLTVIAGSDLCESLSEIEALCCPVVPSKSPTSSNTSSGGVSVPGLLVGLVLSIASTICVIPLV